MALAALILSIITLLLCLPALIYLFAKQFSTHSIQYIDPLAQMMGAQPKGKAIADEFAEIGDKPLGDIGDD